MKIEKAYELIEAASDGNVTWQTALQRKINSYNKEFITKSDGSYETKHKRLTPELKKELENQPNYKEEIERLQKEKAEWKNRGLHTIANSAASKAERIKELEAKINKIKAELLAQSKTPEEKTNLTGSVAMLEKELVAVKAGKEEVEKSSIAKNIENIEKNIKELNEKAEAFNKRKEELGKLPNGFTETETMAVDLGYLKRDKDGEFIEGEPDTAAFLDAVKKDPGKAGQFSFWMYKMRSKFGTPDNYINNRAKDIFSHEKRKEKIEDGSYSLEKQASNLAKKDGKKYEDLSDAEKFTYQKKLISQLNHTNIQYGSNDRYVAEEGKNLDEINKSEETKQMLENTFKNVIEKYYVPEIEATHKGESKEKIFELAKAAYEKKKEESKNAVKNPKPISYEKALEIISDVYDKRAGYIDYLNSIVGGYFKKEELANIKTLPFEKAKTELDKIAKKQGTDLAYTIAQIFNFEAEEGDYDRDKIHPDLIRAENGGEKAVRGKSTEISKAIKKLGTEMMKTSNEDRYYWYYVYATLTKDAHKDNGIKEDGELDLDKVKKWVKEDIAKEEERKGKKLRFTEFMAERFGFQSDKVEAIAVRNDSCLVHFFKQNYDKSMTQEDAVDSATIEAKQATLDWAKSSIPVTLIDTNKNKPVIIDDEIVYALNIGKGFKNPPNIANIKDHYKRIDALNKSLTSAINNTFYITWPTYLKLRKAVDEKFDEKSPDARPTNLVTKDKVKDAAPKEKTRLTNISKIEKAGGLEKDDDKYLAEKYHNGSIQKYLADKYFKGDMDAYMADRYYDGNMELYKKEKGTEAAKKRLMNRSDLTSYIDYKRSIENRIVKDKEKLDKWADKEYEKLKDRGEASVNTFRSFHESRENKYRIDSFINESYDIKLAVRKAEKVLRDNKIKYSDGKLNADIARFIRNKMTVSESVEAAVSVLSEKEGFKDAWDYIQEKNPPDERNAFLKHYQKDSVAETFGTVLGDVTTGIAYAMIVSLLLYGTSKAGNMVIKTIKKTIDELKISGASIVDIKNALFSKKKNAVVKHEYEKIENNVRKYEDLLAGVYESIDNSNYEEAHNNYRKLKPSQRGNPAIQQSIVAAIIQKEGMPPINIPSPGNSCYKAIRTVTDIRIAKGMAESSIAAIKKLSKEI